MIVVGACRYIFADGSLRPRPLADWTNRYVRRSQQRVIRYITGGNVGAFKRTGKRISADGTGAVIGRLVYGAVVSSRNQCAVDPLRVVGVQRSNCVEQSKITWKESRYTGRL